ncbi:MAG: glutathione ABC transporter permease GsiC [Deltaproteobacteria bacterium RIFCSPHIGHO2_02_FULL_40_11]|nr:MAG: glutathione ABC transporter permease GsiC [Deltaproteobacteria bacterium RIFCSPHIGHO2_02_FULL_40_11]
MLYFTHVKSFVLRRLFLLVPILIGISIIVFSLMYFIPGDPVDIILGENALTQDKTFLRAMLHLDQSLPMQYVGFLKDLFQGNLLSIYSKENVWTEILNRFPATLELAIWAMAFAILCSIPLGILSAVKRGSFWDQSSMFISLLGISMPNFWLGPLLIILFAYKIPLFPVSDNEGFLSVILPAITLGTAMMALLSRLTRTSALEVLNEDYIRTARAKGVQEKWVLFKHVLRNALIPVITIAGIQTGALLSGAIITETVFDWPGIGTLLVESIQMRNYPMVQSCVLFIAITYVLINLATDLLYGWIDPRIRLQ